MKAHHWQTSPSSHRLPSKAPSRSNKIPIKPRDSRCHVNYSIKLTEAFKFQAICPLRPYSAEIKQGDLRFCSQSLYCRNWNILMHSFPIKWARELCVSTNCSNFSTLLDGLVSRPRSARCKKAASQLQYKSNKLLDSTIIQFLKSRLLSSGAALNITRFSHESFRKFSVPRSVKKLLKIIFSPPHQLLTLMCVASVLCGGDNKDGAKSKRAFALGYGYEPYASYYGDVLAQAEYHAPAVATTVHHAAPVVAAAPLVSHAPVVAAAAPVVSSYVSHAPVVAPVAKLTSSVVSTNVHHYPSSYFAPSRYIAAAPAAYVAPSAASYIASPYYHAPASYVAPAYAASPLYSEFHRR